MTLPGEDRKDRDQGCDLLHQRNGICVDSDDAISYSSGSLSLSLAVNSNHGRTIPPEMRKRGAAERVLSAGTSIPRALGTDPDDAISLRIIRRDSGRQAHRPRLLGR